MQHNLVRDYGDGPCVLGDHELDTLTRELLQEIRGDERVASVTLTLRVLSHTQSFVRAEARLHDGTICEANMFSASDALWALALDHRLRLPGQPRLPRNRRGRFGARACLDNP